MSLGRCLSLSHLTFAVANAKQAALAWCMQYGFRPFKFQGLETGSRDRCAHAVTQGDIVLVFVSPYHDEPVNQPLHSYIVQHGNSVQDIGKWTHLPVPPIPFSPLSPSSLQP